MNSQGRYFCEHEEELDKLDFTREILEELLVDTNRRIGALLERCTCVVPGCGALPAEPRRTALASAENQSPDTSGHSCGILPFGPGH